MHEGDAEPLEIGLENSRPNRRVLIEETLRFLIVFRLEHHDAVGPLANGTSGQQKAPVVQGSIQMVEMSGDLFDFFLRGIVRKLRTRRL